MIGVITKILRVFVSIAVVAVALIFTLPLIVPIEPLDDLKDAQSLAGEDSQFLTVSYPGTSGLNIHYREAGNGDRVFVFLHGFGSNLYTWDQLFTKFAAKGRAIAFDRPPFGLSSRLVPGDWAGPNPYSRDAAVSQTISVFNALKIEKAVIVGNSAGGSLALRIALTHPTRVEGLILASPAVFTGNGSPSLIKTLSTVPQFQRLGPILVRFAADIVPSDKMDAHQLAQHRLTFRVNNWDVAAWQYIIASTEFDLTNLLPAVDVPTLVLGGTNDQLIPMRENAHVAAKLSNARIKTLSNCGHMPQLECPDAFWAASLDWTNHTLSQNLQLEGK